MFGQARASDRRVRDAATRFLFSLAATLLLLSSCAHATMRTAHGRVANREDRATTTAANAARPASAPSSLSSEDRSSSDASGKPLPLPPNAHGGPGGKTLVAAGSDDSGRWALYAWGA